MSQETRPTCCWSCPSRPLGPHAPVKVLLQQVQPLLHLSVGQVRVAVVLPGRRLSTLGWLPRSLAGMLAHPLVPVDLWGEEGARTHKHTHGKPRAAPEHQASSHRAAPTEFCSPPVGFLWWRKCNWCFLFAVLTRLFIGIDITLLCTVVGDQLNYGKSLANQQAEAVSSSGARHHAGPLAEQRCSRRLLLRGFKSTSQSCRTRRRRMVSQLLCCWSFTYHFVFTQIQCLTQLYFVLTCVGGVTLGWFGYNPLMVYYCVGFKFHHHDS